MLENNSSDSLSIMTSSFIPVKTNQYNSNEIFPLKLASAYMR